MLGSPSVCSRAIPKGFFPTEDIGQIFAVTEAAPDISFTAMSERQQLVTDAILLDKKRRPGKYLVYRRYQQPHPQYRPPASTSPSKPRDLVVTHPARIIQRLRVKLNSGAPDTVSANLPAGAEHPPHAAATYP